MVDVFKTNVRKKRDAARLLRELQAQFPGCRPGFDLDDCDKILRIESPERLPDPPLVVGLLARKGFSCAPL